MPTTPQAAELATFTEKLADKVRPLSLKWFRQKLEVHTKSDTSPVTIADRSVEAELRRLIGEHYPDHGILGEEMGSDHTEAEYVWAVDPIDGTASFVSGYPLWGTLLALLHRGSPVLGVIDIPALDERWIGGQDLPSRMNDTACHTSDCASLKEATLYATSPDIFTGNDAEIFERLSQTVRMRRFGGDCYSYALLASGHVDLVVETDLKPYDYLALVPVVENAGGVMTDWDGQPLDMQSDGRVVAAANEALHQQALAFIAASTD